VHSTGSSVMSFRRFEECGMMTERREVGRGPPHGRPLFLTYNRLTPIMQKKKMIQGLEGIGVCNGRNRNA
jgi:hypothetical protein